ncbi:hypothetical protein GRJ2_000562500 [Grus japonensis]|uniref:Uncharacterized protein n=1 Tax=Grus japonensis TaxID=30415 RepID=A0ABC9W852_GRUJA
MTRRAINIKSNRSWGTSGKTNGLAQVLGHGNMGREEGDNQKARNYSLHEEPQNHLFIRERKREKERVEERNNEEGEERRGEERRGEERRGEERRGEEKRREEKRREEKRREEKRREEKRREEKRREEKEKTLA